MSALNKQTIKTPGRLYSSQSNSKWQLRRVRIIREYVEPSLGKLLEKFISRLKRPWVSLTYRLYQFIGISPGKWSFDWSKMATLLLFFYVLPGSSIQVESSTVLLEDPKESPQKTSIHSQSLAPAFIEEIPNREAREYIKTFAGLAIEGMHEFGIPASIKMAQAIIESRAGHSKLAVESNNHFGIKCKKKCRGCTCRNYTDDDIYDMFRVFEDPSESWKVHSHLLAYTQRYSKLKSYGTDYKKWARGLKAAGYATDPKYASKLIRVIEKYQLYKLDEYH